MQAMPRQESRTQDVSLRCILCFPKSTSRQHHCGPVVSCLIAVAAPAVNACNNCCAVRTGFRKAYSSIHSSGSRAALLDANN